MKKTNLFYTVEVDVEGNDQDGQYVTGNKTVSVYKLKNNLPAHFTILELENEDNSEDAIREYLDENGYETTAFELWRL